MPPSASMLFPTRRRRDYLAVALASVAPQARRARRRDRRGGGRPGGPGDASARRRATAAATSRTARRAGSTSPATPAIDAAAGELLCLLDDDVEVWPGWLEALLAAAAAHPEHEAFGGPIRPRLEGARLRACGREPLPITVARPRPGGPRRRRSRGARTSPLRRSALERIGRFDPALGGAGDEEDWQRRLRAAGGRIRYVAAAGVDHRRAGADARVRALSRAAFHRGRASRRYDASGRRAPARPPSCARWPAASGTSRAAAAAPGSC